MTISSTGWVLFEFDTPFEYNGTDHLMVDFSFYNTTWGANFGYVRCTNSASRVLYTGGNTLADPLTWTGTTPTPIDDTFVPNIKLVSGHTVPVTPAATGNFTAGIWSGALTFSSAATGVYLKANDGAGHTGRSNTFNVQAGSPNGSLTVTIAPAAAVTSGAQWRRSGESTWHSSGSTQTEIPAGNHIVEFSSVPGWEAPASQSVTINSGATANVTGTYTQMSMVWVDFAFGGVQFGTELFPYSLLEAGVSAITSGGTVRIKTGMSNQPVRLTKPVRIEAIGGPVTIGR
ncbi:hypothetical protein LLG95_01150 [bacterium]|nr:hypothetical protein [bacterium]